MICIRCPYGVFFLPFLYPKIQNISDKLFPMKVQLSNFSSVKRSEACFTTKAIVEVYCSFGGYSRVQSFELAGIAYSTGRDANFSSLGESLLRPVPHRFQVPLQLFEMDEPITDIVPRLRKMATNNR